MILNMFYKQKAAERTHCPIVVLKLKPSDYREVVELPLSSWTQAEQNEDQTADGWRLFLRET